jgi:hypothetical protein
VALLAVSPGEASLVLFIISNFWGLELVGVKCILEVVGGKLQCFFRLKKSKDEK